MKITRIQDVLTGNMARDLGQAAGGCASPNRFAFRAGHSPVRSLRRSARWTPIAPANEIDVRNCANEAASLGSLSDPIAAALIALSAHIEQARAVDALTKVAAMARRHAVELHRLDLGASALTRYLTGANDLLTCRVIDLALQRYGKAPADWCWIVMGSQARGEQTFCTDQDNGIIFRATGTAEADEFRQWFLPVAESINRDLDACGMTLCKGGIMAGNAECCLSLEEWKERFATWVRIPDPQALLNATIFFDFRVLHGAAELADGLRHEVLRLAPAGSTFLRLMAQNALDVDVPIGLFGRFVTDHGSGAYKSLDIKKRGVRIFVDAARNMALAAGCGETGTEARLRAAGPAAGLRPDEIEAAVIAFNQMQRLRMHAQVAHGQMQAEDDCNRLMPARLDPLDRNALLYCLERARLIQQRLTIAFMRDI